MKLIKESENESRIEVLSKKANEEYLEKRKKYSLWTKTIHEHWDNLFLVPFMLLQPDYVMYRSNPNDWFYIGVFLFFVSLVYFIIHGIV